MSKLFSLILFLIVFVRPVTVSANAGFQGEYFNNPDLSDTPMLVRVDNEINFDWSSESPDPSISKDLFSVRWTKNETFENDGYRFTLTTDDGARLYLDGNLILDKWFDQRVSTYTVDQQITAGIHTIKMEFYERYEAGIAKLSYQKLIPSTSTPSPSATPTPIPSSSPQPTVTPTPTASPTPTSTPIPTPVPSAATGQVLGSQELPKTGLPALAWITVALIPVGLKLRGFYKIKGELTDSPNYLWEERQFKVGT